METPQTDIESIAKPLGFTVESSEHIAEIGGDAYVMKHGASGARLLYLKNDDPNKAFSISFKTPAADDTGVFHILEHSVLCGSDKFPVKEPFVNLLKSSMQTFLNAMTFPDKTMYPVASTNEADLINLMDVYLDAVFHPAIYGKRTIFEQEGWHLEVVPPHCEGDVCTFAPTLAYNGVVFNEMKGALSEPDAILIDALSAALFPDTTYRFESGGTPAAIPSLTYEGFLDTHRRHYRSDNSYIMLYGDMDLERVLAFLTREYLEPLAAAGLPEAGAPNPLELQKPVIALGRKVEMATSPENSGMALGYVVGRAHDRKRVLATGILLDAIAGSNEAPLKRALLDAKLAGDVQVYLSDGIAQPFAVFQLRELTDDGAARFREVLDKAVGKLVADGIDPALIEASLSHNEFVMREGNYGYPDGIIYAMSSMSGWLYNDADATEYLRYNALFDELRDELDTGFFERLLREIVLENNHFAAVELVPVERTDDPLADSLAAMAAGYSAGDFEAVEEEVRILREAQETPDSPEALATLPALTLADVQAAPTEPPYAYDAAAFMPLIRHEVFTNGIAYFYRYFDLSPLDFDELPYVTLLALLLGRLDTQAHTAAELDTLIQSKLGNLSFFAEVIESNDDMACWLPKLTVSTSALSHNAAACAEIADEVLRTTKFDDFGRIRDILQQKRISLESDIMNGGHSAALLRASSYYLPAGVIREQLGGISFYRFLRDLLAHFEDRKDDLARHLEDVRGRIVADSRSVLSFAGTDEDLAAYRDALETAGEGALSAGEAQAPQSQALAESAPAPTPKNEAFIVPSDVTYTGMGYDSHLLGVPYGGAWLLCSRALSYDFLWNEVRVKGGAYGAGFSILRAGSMRFYSYRDPHIDETVGRFEGAGAWVSAYAPTASELDGFKISTVAGLDKPCKPRELLRRQDGDFFSGTAPEFRTALREEVLDATAADVNALGAPVSEAAAKHLVCTVGNGSIIAGAHQGFEVIDLFKDSDE